MQGQRWKYNSRLLHDLINIAQCRRQTLMPQRHYHILEPRCNLDLCLWPPKYNQVISRDQWFIPESFIEIAQVVHDMWCSKHLTSMACCDLDLWPPESNQVMSRGWWIFPVSFIKLFKTFMRYCGNNTWADKQTNEQMGQPKTQCLCRYCVVQRRSLTSFILATVSFVNHWLHSNAVSSGKSVLQRSTGSHESASHQYQMAAFITRRHSYS